MTKIRNPVAKHGRRFNKAQVFKDRARHAKHRSDHRGDLKR